MIRVEKIKRKDFTGIVSRDGYFFKDQKAEVFQKFGKSLLLQYLILNFLLASLKLLTNSNNPSSNPLQRL
jgi:hypothetical protein